LKTRTPQICVECGLCCDGTLYTDVVFSREKVFPDMEKELVRFPGLEWRTAKHDPEPKWRLSLTPCQYLGVEKENCCSIYEDRPSICSAHDCWMLWEYNAGFKTYDYCINEIKRIKKLKKKLKKEGLSEEEVGVKIRQMGELDAFHNSTEKMRYLKRRLGRK